jgi:hypothetical protein
MKNVLLFLLIYGSAYAQKRVVPPKSPQPRTVQPSPSLPELIDLVRPSVVRIQTEFGSGTGFFINEEGVVLTANHVVSSPSAQATQIKIQWAIPPTTLPGGGAITGSFNGTLATIVDVDVDHDIAILKPLQNPLGAGSSKDILIGSLNLSAKKGSALISADHFRDGVPVFVSGYPLSFPVLITTSGGSPLLYRSRSIT